MSSDFEQQQAAFVAAQREALGGLGHPVYAVAGLPIHGLSAFDQDGTRGAAVVHAVGQVRLSVHSMTPLRGPAADVVRAMLAAAMFEPAEMGATSEADMRAELAARLEDARARAAAITLTEQPLAVDGVDVPFTFATLGSVWTAATDHEGVRIAVMSIGVAPDGLGVARVADPASHLPA